MIPRKISKAGKTVEVFISIQTPSAYGRTLTLIEPLSQGDPAVS